MASLMERVSAAVQRLRARFQWLDHTVRTVQHYGIVNGNAQAGAVTYFGFLSFFPILALGFFVVGQLARIYPAIREQMVAEIDKMLPGVVGTGGIKLDTVTSFSGLAGLLGLLGLLYAGLGWLSGLRRALEVMFATPRGEQPGFLFGKLRDLGALTLIGLTLMVSVVLSGAVTGFSGLILGWIGVDSASPLATALLGVVGHALAILASTVLLLTMFTLLVVDTHVPRWALVRGALLGAVGFEVLKSLANLLLAQTRGQPAFQAFGVALILLVWINYFSRLVMYAAAWAYTSPDALAQRTAEAMRAPGAALTVDDPESVSPVPVGTSHRPGPRPTGPVPPTTPSPWLVVAGAAAAAGAVAVIVRGARR